jgi:hypothetical protein
MGANAQTAVPVFSVGEVLTSAEMTQINTGIPVFATTALRDDAFGGIGEKVLAQGQYCFIEATNQTQYYNGTAWVIVDLGAWQTWTPSFTNLTVGNGTTTARYAQIGKTVIFSIKFVFGSTSSMGSGPTSNWPVAPASSIAAQLATLNIQYQDAGTNTYFGCSPANGNNTTNFSLGRNSISGNLIGVAESVTAALPFTWTTNDAIFISGSYEAA